MTLNIGLTCPNRDGKLSNKGCVFCGEKGAGDFAESNALSLKEQFDLYKSKLKNKPSDAYYIAYFQSFTNTYGDIEYLERKYNEAAEIDGVVGISIATRPDCIDKDIVNLLESLSRKKMVFVELGFQTSKTETIDLINRCYENSVYDRAVEMLSEINVNIVTHLILGLPNETKTDVLNTIKYISDRPLNGVKLQLMQVLKDTELENMYNQNFFKLIDFEDYIDLVVACIENLPPEIVIHRLTGDPPKNILVAPKYSTNKKRILNTINKELNIRDSFQGKYFFRVY